MASKDVILALETLHREIEKLEPAIKHVEMAQTIIGKFKEVPQKHVELLQEIKNDDKGHKEELKSLFVRELALFTDENKILQATTAEIQRRVVDEQQELSKLRETLQSFHDRIEKINFPERLDKLDANVAGIMAAIQSVQSRLDSLERNVTDRLKDLADYQKETRVSYNATLEQTKATIITIINKSSKNQMVLSYITLGLLIVAIIFMCFMYSQGKGL